MREAVDRAVCLSSRSASVAMTCRSDVPYDEGILIGHNA
jgi:hypothetical protein